MSTKDEPFESKFALVRSAILHAESALQARIEPGQVSDFIFDNFCDYSSADVRALRDAFNTRRMDGTLYTPRA